MTEKLIMTADEVAALLSISKPTAYRIIRILNEELKKKGYLVLNGRISRVYLNKRLYSSEQPEG